jgi:hypothetical protein
MTIYERHRKITAADVRPGDIAYIPWSGRTVEVQEVRRAVWINPDRIAMPLVIAGVWRVDGLADDQTYNDDARWKPTDTIYVLGDQRDMIEHDYPSRRYMQRRIEIEVG